MAKAKKVVQAAGKIKKKIWYRLQAPRLFNNQIVGETIADDPELVKGRVVALSLMNLIGDMKKQNSKIYLKVKEVKGETAFTDVCQYEIIPSSLKRLVRKGKSRLDDSFVCSTADNVLLRVKPFMLINNSLKGSVKSALRARSNGFIINYFKKSTYENVLRDIISTKLQRQVAGAIKRIYPVRTVEIRSLEIVSPTAKKVSLKKSEAPEEAVEEEQPRKFKKKLEETKVEEEELVTDKEPVSTDVEGASEEFGEDETEEAEEVQEEEK
jgi:small subunit ribosomal protein S3Ae